MAGLPPPTKPPRSVKHPKESSGLLMSVIRTLSASESNEQRDREKAKLEKEYKRSDQRLDELISFHHNDLTQVMQVFAKLSASVTASREKILGVKENLLACKQLLHCRRDELKKLWLEGVEHKHVLQLLEEIEQLREVPSQLAIYMAKKQYLSATKLLVKALTLGDGSLEKVEALRELRGELQAKKQLLHIKLLEELSQLLYVESTQEVLALRRQGSGRDMNASASPFQRASELRSSARGKARRNLLEISPFPGASAGRVGLSPKGSMPGDDFDLSEDFDTTNLQLNPEHFMAVLIECLAVLGKIPEAVESLKVQMQSELLGVVSRTTRALLDGVVLQAPMTGPSATSLLPVAVLPNGAVTPSQISNGDVKQKSIGSNQSNHPLPELLYTLLDQFRRIAESHNFVLRRLSHTCEKYILKNIRLYEISDIWSMVQAVMQLVLNDYLDIQNTAADNQQATASFSEPSNDISFYFSRRKIQRPKKMPLFKFEHSLSISNGTMLADSADFKMHSDGRLQRDKLLICPSDPHNITLIFIPITKFIEEIELATNCKIGVPCTLNAFLADYIKEVFLGRYQSKMSSTIEMVTKSPEAWRGIITPEQMREMRRTRPLLQSTVLIESCVKDLQQLIMALPVYTEHFLSIVTNLLRSYRENCQAAYRGKVQPESEDKRIFSAAFLKDEDISRFIKSLPNWANLQAQKAIHLQRQKRRALHREETTDEESPEDIRQRNEKEAEILASALGEGGVNHHEIISDVKHLRSLALLQESMEWFAGCIYSFASELPRLSPTIPVVRVMSDVTPAAQSGTVEGLQQLAREFEDLADTCLLVLHLEVRVQCFHYLLPKVKDYGRLADCGMDSQEPDPKVLELTRALTSCDEALTNILQPLKCRYVFEGLGHFMSKILMSVAQYIDRIDEGGIQKMCRNIFTLQQTLTNITMTREVALDHARHYYELFYLTPEEILSGVVEKGPQFSELEYMNAFQLVHRSYPDQDVTALNSYLSRLSDILGEVGVTV